MSVQLQELKLLSEQLNAKVKTFECPALLPPVEPPADTPPTPNEAFDTFGIREVYEDVMPPKVHINRKYKRSTHGGKPRDTFYFENVNFMNMEMTCYKKIDFIKDDETSFKFWGGHHSGSGDNETTRAGKCYSIGVSRAGPPHIAKEYPYHPKGNYSLAGKAIFYNPDFKTLGKIDDRIIGHKCIAFLKELDGVSDGVLFPHFQYLVDLETTKITEPANKWTPFFKCIDKGDWVGKPYLKLQGQLHGDDNMWYDRTDQVGKTTLDFGYSVRNIDPAEKTPAIPGLW